MGLAAVRSKAVVLLLLIVTPIVEFFNCSMFCCALLCVHSSFAISIQNVSSKEGGYYQNVTSGPRHHMGK